MSTIGQYRHKILGRIECPSDYDFVFESPTKIFCIYQLQEGVPEEEADFKGKEGDIIVGGGSGEAQALRVSYPEAVYFFKVDDWDSFESRDDLFKAFWSPAFSYKVGVGFRKLGWDPEISLEQWLAERVINILLETGKLSLGDLTGHCVP